MMHTVRKKYTNHIKLFNRWLSIFMAGVYILGIATADLLHPQFHRHQVVHSPTTEQDPCHRAIYHGEQEKDPTHHKHLTTAFEKCPFCDVIFQRAHLGAGNVYSFKEIKNIPLFFSESSALASIPCTTTFSRGPPAIG